MFLSHVHRIPARPRHTVAAMALLLPLGMIGCGGEEPAPPTPTPAAETAATAPANPMPDAPAAAAQAPEAPAAPAAVDIDTTRFPALGEPAIIELLDAGAEPRRPLRYAFEAGQSEAMHTSMNMHMMFSMNGQDMPPMDLPRFTVSGEAVPETVTDDGDAHYTFRFTGGKVDASENVPPQMLQAMRDAMAMIEGVTGVATVSSRGLTTDAEINGDESLQGPMASMVEPLRQSVKQMATPLPEDPVGEGAKWEIRQTVDQQGMRIYQTLVMNLVRLSENDADLEFTIDQKAPPQDFQPAGTPPGTDMHLVSSDGIGAGNTKLVFNRLISEASITMDASTQMEVNANGQVQPMAMDMTIDITVSAE